MVAHVVFAGGAASRTAFNVLHSNIDELCETQRETEEKGRDYPLPSTKPAAPRIHIFARFLSHLPRVALKEERGGIKSHRVVLHP